MAARALPLLTWQEDAEAARLAEQRRLLQARIARLPRMSHRRVELSLRLKEITSAQLALETRKGEVA